MLKENEQLKQQLNDLSNKIVKEFENIGFVSFDGDLYVDRVDIDKILKKYEV